MELRHLEHFLTVAEELSFTRAASRVHIAQSALSVSVRTLERELGARLIDRSTHHVELTDAGRALVTEARRTLLAAEAARDAVAATVGGIRGTLRLGIRHSLALVDLAGLLTRYHQDRPRGTDRAEGRRHRRIGGTGRCGPRWPAESRLRGNAGRLSAGLQVRPLVSEPLSLACPPDHRFASRRRIRIAELADERFVDFPSGWGPGVASINCSPTTASTGRSGSRSPTSWWSANWSGLIPVVPSPRLVSMIGPADRPLSAAARAFRESTTNRVPGHLIGQPERSSIFEITVCSSMCWTA